MLRGWPHHKKSSVLKYYTITFNTKRIYNSFYFCAHAFAALMRIGIVTADTAGTANVWVVDFIYISNMVIWQRFI
jgi:hypothetical protein